MNCCDAYGNCRQGRDCPIRVAKVGRRIQGPEPLRGTPWRLYVRHLAKWMLIVIVLMFSAALVVGVLHA